MLATSTPFQTMVEGTDQTVEFRLQISLPGGIYPDATLAVSKLSIDASTTTDMPAGTRLEAGYPAMQASFTLTGMVDPTDESKTAEWLFGRYQTTSPLYKQDAFRCPVTIDIGLYPDGSAGVPELLRKFTGYVDEYVEDTEGGIAFTCIDLRSNLRNVPDIPAVVTAPPFNAGLTSEFVIDAQSHCRHAFVLAGEPAHHASVGGDAVLAVARGWDSDGGFVDLQLHAGPVRDRAHRWPRRFPRRRQLQPRRRLRVYLDVHRILGTVRGVLDQPDDDLGLPDRYRRHHRQDQPDVACHHPRLDR
jgi:hypothetical protein